MIRNRDVDPFGVNEQAIYALGDLPIEEAQARISELARLGVEVWSLIASSPVGTPPRLFVTGYMTDLSSMFAHLSDEEKSEWFGKINDLALRAGMA